MQIIVKLFIPSNTLRFNLIILLPTLSSSDICFECFILFSLHQNLLCFFMLKIYHFVYSQIIHSLYQMEFPKFCSSLMDLLHHQLKLILFIIYHALVLILFFVMSFKFFEGYYAFD